MELHDELGPIKGGDFFSVARFDNRHMIISDSENGVYKVDIESWKTQGLPGPTPIELRNVHELFVDGGDLYAFDCLSGNNLWRWSHEQWSEIVPDFDDYLAGIGYAPRIWLHTKDGMIIQAYGHEAWFLPHAGPARMLSWKCAFPIPQIEAIVQLKDGTFCILGNESLAVCRDVKSQIFYSEIADPINNWSSHRIVEVEPDAAWLSSKRIWMIPKRDSTVLKEWDGKTWLIHPIPSKGRGGVSLNEDDQGRIWIYNGDGTTDIFDPVKNQWQSFSHLDDCLAAGKEHPVHFQHFWPAPCPRYSTDKQQIAYYDYNVSKLHYYNGSIWRIFRWIDITGWPGDSGLNQPWFDAKDRLCVSPRGGSTMWQCDENGDWSSVPYVAHPSDNYDPPEKPKLIATDLQNACATQNPNTVRTDNLGGFWFTKDANLYRCIGDQWVSIFAPTEVTPFNSNPSLLAVDVDSQGNVFINAMTAQTQTHRYLILAKRPAPQTTIGLKQMDEDSLMATFNPHSDGIINFRWQLDDNAWQLIKTNSLNLEHLPNGPHLLKVTAIDDQLNMDAMPAMARFEIKIDPNRQMAILVAQLFDPDFSRRELAVEALAQQSATALPALQKARETATDDQRWWIDAAIQECERQAASPSKK